MILREIFIFGAICVACAPVVAEGVKSLTPTAKPNSLILMHAAKCNPQEAKQSLLTVLSNSKIFTSFELNAVRNFFGEEGNLPLQQVSLESRREQMLKIVEIIVALRSKSHVFDFISRNNSNFQKRSFLSRRFMSALNVDVISNPSEDLPPEEFLKIVQTFPCLRAKVIPDLVFSRDEYLDSNLHTSTYDFHTGNIFSGTTGNVSTVTTGNVSTGTTGNVSTGTTGNVSTGTTGNVSTVTTGNARSLRFGTSSFGTSSSGGVKANDPYCGIQWYMRNSQLLEAWNVHTGSSSDDMVIGIVDAGCSFHPDLAPNLWTNTADENCVMHSGRPVDSSNPTLAPGCYGWDFGDDDGNPLDEPLDSIHGTAVAGVVAAATNNAFGISGVCWNCKLVCLKIADSEGFISLSATLAAYDYILKKKIKISNHSYTGFGFNELHYEAIKQISDANLLFVTAAGNQGCNVDFDFDQRGKECKDEDGNSLGVLRPGGYNITNVITVGASSRSGHVSAFSNYGKLSVDLFAPGESIPVLWNTLDTNPSLNGFASASGTSYSAPLVTGVAALVWKANPDLSAQQVKERIVSSSAGNVELEEMCVGCGTLNALKAMLSSEQSDIPLDASSAPEYDFTSFFYSLTSSSLGIVPMPVSSLPVVVFVVQMSFLFVG